MPDDLIDDLSGTVEEREAATQELLLAKERAVEPLLHSLADSQRAEARAALVEILVSLMIRVDDERIGSALTRLLAQDSDATLRGRLIRLAGMHRRTQLLDAVITALGDTDAKVRLEAIIAFDSFSGRLGPEQEAVVDSLARLLLHDDEIAVRNEAMIRVVS